jgi:hypothetical protein
LFVEVTIMSSVINVNFSHIGGNKFTGQLRSGYTQADIRKIIADRLGSDNYRLIVNGQEMQEGNSANFEEFKKNNIKNNSTIYICQRMDGGSGLVDVLTHRRTILADLQEELNKMDTLPDLIECSGCLEMTSCIRFCCNSILCKECFPNYFHSRDYKLKCLICSKILAPENFFVTAEFLASLNQLDETAMMARNIDFQICTCGAYAINSTMYAKQKCDNCQRWMCFFCNNDWDDTKNMKNTQYTCTVNCLWETKITYQLVKLEFNRDMKVPNRRCCPKCQKCGSYDQKCKYHKCPCGYEFCFICLKSKKVCILEFNSQYNLPCGSVAQQTFEIFPRLVCSKENVSTSSNALQEAKIFIQRFIHRITGDKSQ